MTAFWRTDDTVHAVVEEPEARLVRRLVTDVQTMLTPDGSAPVSTVAGGPGGAAGSLLDWLEVSPPVAPPQDPALARLLPDGYRDDPAAAGELRRLTERSLRDAKSRAAQRLLDSLPDRGGTLRLDLDTAEAWLTALNDVRLVLGVRLNVTEDSADGADGDDDDPVAVAYQVYQWLTAVQDNLVSAVCGWTASSGAGWADHGD